MELDLASSSDTPLVSGEGITIEKIREMVELFYRRTQQDDLLGMRIMKK